jgi:acetylornithine deacetylase/succinyl-diaminopimelate desuccinylase-like protein
MPTPSRLHLISTLFIALAGVCGTEAARAQAVAATPEQVRPTVDQAITQLLAAPKVQTLLDAVKGDHERSIEDLKMLTEIEAPPFKEQKRAESFLARMKALGLADAKIDAEGNVVGLRKGTGGGPKLLVTAHLDTVFPAGTDVKVKEHDGKLHAPGISDDTRGLAVLLSWLKVLNDSNVQTVGDLLFVGSVGEEELGNLRGMKRLFNDHLDIDGMVGLEPVADGGVLVLGTGSHRYEVMFKGPGGHSYAAFGQVPSAIHAMGRAIAKISDVQTPKSPKTTFTVGTVAGGISTNSIAGEAAMQIDMRSSDPAALSKVEAEIMAHARQAVADENARWNATSLSVDIALIGDRPAGSVALDSPMIQAAALAVQAIGFEKIVFSEGSNDANLPVSLGIPAIRGSSGGRSGGTHSLGEWYQPERSYLGPQAWFLATLGLVGMEGVSRPLLPKR